MLELVAVGLTSKSIIEGRDTHIYLNNQRDHADEILTIMHELHIFSCV